MKAITLNECITINEVFDSVTPYKLVNKEIYDNDSARAFNYSYKINDMYSMIVKVNASLGEKIVDELNGKYNNTDVEKFINRMGVDRHTLALDVSFELDLLDLGDSLESYDNIDMYSTMSNIDPSDKVYAFKNLATVADSIDRVRNYYKNISGTLVNFMGIKDVKDKQKGVNRRNNIYLKYIDKTRGISDTVNFNGITWCKLQN